VERVVFLGNHQIHERVPVRDANGDDTGDYNIREYPGKSRTEYGIPDEWTVAEVIADLTHVWPLAHSKSAPKWVASNDSALATVLGSVFGCPVREVDLDHQPDPTPADVASAVTEG
jgi:hypothetical protein